MFPPKQPRTTHDSAPHARGRTETHLGVGYHAWLPWVERTPRVSRLRNSRTLRYAVCVLPHFLTSPSPPPPSYPTSSPPRQVHGEGARHASQVPRPVLADGGPRPYIQVRPHWLAVAPFPRAHQLARWAFEIQFGLYAARSPATAPCHCLLPRHRLDL
jgi:hypothetical protein